MKGSTPAQLRAQLADALELESLRPTPPAPPPRQTVDAIARLERLVAQVVKA